jgi:hypothetical protein
MNGISNQFNKIIEPINNSTKRQIQSLVNQFNLGEEQAANAQNTSNELLREQTIAKAQQMGLRTEKKLLSDGTALAKAA